LHASSQRICDAHAVGSVYRHARQAGRQRKKKTSLLREEMKALIAQWYRVKEKIADLGLVVSPLMSFVQAQTGRHRYRFREPIDSN